jgi:hypothetical protein
MDGTKLAKNESLAEEGAEEAKTYYPKENTIVPRGLINNKKKRGMI